jgi:NNP family nitrate/nitrite transporter-like MFS transporter
LLVTYLNRKKYSQYYVNVDPDQDDKATEIRLCSLKRPHMRAFHCAWWSFFNAFFIWFAITPLQSEIRTSLGLSTQQMWTASIVGVGGTIFLRFLLGPLCDKYGSRILMSAVLCAASIPTAMTGLVNSAAGLAVLRLFIGIAGGSFVMCQYWTTRFFTKEIVGTANAVVGGWGNLGGGVTQLVMGSALFPLFKLFFSDLPPADAATMAWRTVCVVPAVVAFATGLTILFISDDAPTGNYTELKKRGSMPEVSAATSFRVGAMNLNTWILFVHYACCFGVELTMHNASSLYFKDHFGLSTSSAAAVSSIFGWMLIFTRAMGGWLSDKANSRWGMRGRLWTHTIAIAGEGAAVLIFANTKTLGLAIFIMVIFSIFCQGATGTTYGIVPYVDPPSTGSISGIVGAGGNVGAVCFGLGFRQLAPDANSAFAIMGATVLGSTILSAFVSIKGSSGLLWGTDDAPKQTLAAPEKFDESDAEEINL